jgi:hypothetical protein
MKEMPFNDKVFCFILTVATICIITIFEHFRAKRRRNADYHPVYIDEDGVSHEHLSLSKLSPFAAKKIYERYCLLGEICPITREVFLPEMLVDVMPCGHVYNQEALRKCFRLINNRRTCLVCKQRGEPTYL